MRMIDVIRRPNRCPLCGGDICDILYGEPTATWYEDYLKATGHRAVLAAVALQIMIPIMSVQNVDSNFGNSHSLPRANNWQRMLC